MYIPVNAGLTTPIRLKKKTLTMVNGAPKVTLTDADDSLILCSWKGRGGTESTSKGMVTIEDTAEVLMYYRDDVDEKDVLYLHDDSTKAYEVLNVENVEQRNLYLILKVRRVRPS